MAEKSFWSDIKNKEWFSNFFFYYGKYIIVLIVFIIIFAGAAYSCTKKEVYDCEIYYISDQHLESKAFTGLENELKKVVDDVDGTQGVKVGVYDFTVVPENAAVSDVDLYIESKVHMEIATGHGYLYIMNELWKDYCVNNDIMEDISSYTGETAPVYCCEISNNTLLNNLGIKNEEKLYIGIRKLNNDRVDDTVEVKKQNNAKKVFEYILKNN